jgi:predicted Zn-dependent protease
MLLSQTEAKQIVDKILSYSKLDECDIDIDSSYNGNTRFANNSITTSAEVRGLAIQIASTKGTQTGHYGVDEVSDDALRKAVAKSEELAGYAIPDPEYMEPIGPQKYPEIDAFDEATAKSGHEQMIPRIKATIAGAEEKHLIAAGFYERGAGISVIANKRGNFGYSTGTSAGYSLTVRTSDGTGSGWASAGGHRMHDVDALSVARVAIKKAVMSQKPRRLEPGKYTVILEPAAVSDMVIQILNSFDARDADEGRSLLTRKGSGTRLGEKMFSEKITMRSDPFDARNPGMPWNSGELPARKMTWIDKGVVANLGYGRYWAKKKNAEPTPYPGSDLIFEGEEYSLDDLITSTDRGLLVTRFWYIRDVNPQTGELTGLTRDGLFMVEKGKVAYPVMNFRWNESPANVLANVEMLGRSVLSGGKIVPAMKVREFNFTSVSDAV